jgi:hypothetical protein
MKTFAVYFLGALMISSSIFARDLTYKFGAGYRQVSTTARVNDDGTSPGQHVNGLQLTYGVAHDLQIGTFFGFVSNFDFTMLGPTVRYDLQRLINRDASVWSNLHLFTEFAFFAKFGGNSKAGITLHAPYLGFEILPFGANNFAISTQAGLVIDFVKKNRIGFTQGMFGDVGIKYYF